MAVFSAGCTAMPGSAVFVSPGSSKADFRLYEAPLWPPSISSGPIMLDSRCGCTANTFLPGCKSGELGSVMVTGDTVTTCGIHQLSAVKGAKADSVVKPSLRGAIVTLAPAAGALVRRTV